MAEFHREEIAKLESLYANNPEGRVFTHLAEAYRKAGELGRAESILQDGLTRHADYSSAHVVLGRVLSDMGRPDGARAAFRRVLELDRHNLIALRSLGDLAAGAGEFDEALYYYRELLPLDPADERLRRDIARVEEEARRDVGVGVGDAVAPAPEHDPGAWAQPVETAAAEITSDDVPTGELSSTELRSDPLSFGEAPAGELSSTELRSDSLSFGEAPAGELSLSSDEGSAGEEASAERGASAGEPEEDGAEGVAPDHGVWIAEPGDDSAPVTAQDDAIPVWEFVPSDEVETVAEEVPSLNWEEDVGAEQETLPGDLGVLADAPAEAGATAPSEAVPVSELEASTGAGSGVGGGEEELPGEWLTSTEWDRVSGGEGVTAEPESHERLDDLQAERVGQPEEVLTETIAELYSAQGLHDRAAEVYRSLLLERPDDEKLRDRLRQSEAAAQARDWRVSLAAPASEHTVFEAMQAADAEESAAWLERVESAWTGGGGVAGAGPTPYAWTDPGQVEEPGEGARISDYFRDLLAWRPRSADPAAGSEGREPEAEEPLMLAAEPLLLMDEVAEFEEEPEPTFPAEAEPIRGAQEETTQPQEEDEDLEMFRSWLQSLKK